MNILIPVVYIKLNIFTFSLYSSIYLYYFVHFIFLAFFRNSFHFIWIDFVTREETKIKKNTENKENKKRIKSFSFCWILSFLYIFIAITICVLLHSFFVFILLYIETIQNYDYDRSFVLKQCAVSASLFLGYLLRWTILNTQFRSIFFSFVYFTKIVLFFFCCAFGVVPLSNIFPLFIFFLLMAFGYTIGTKCKTSKSSSSCSWYGNDWSWTITNTRRFGMQCWRSNGNWWWTICIFNI